MNAAGGADRSSGRQPWRPARAAAAIRIAALYDVHGNLPALEAVLDEVRLANVDQVVVGGDVVPGPLPQETLRRLLELELPVHFIHGNSELALLA